jgi:hypothetical protein
MENVLMNFISQCSNEARAQLTRYGDLTQQNVLWAGTPGYNTRITQEGIDGVATFADAGLTQAQVADAVYALEQIRGIMTAAMPALTVLAGLR